MMLGLTPLHLSPATMSPQYSAAAAVPEPDNNAVADAATTTAALAAVTLLERTLRDHMVVDCLSSNGKRKNVKVRLGQRVSHSADNSLSVQAP
ncbi:hypothetical protein [Nocardia cyriacigeorgica]|nr:hypothetical protein [Nocardia cyriacigeorgica]